MPIIDAYGERKAMKVREDTFGHLAPKTRRSYKGTILIAESVYPGQGRTIIRTDFPGLESSPWFYYAMCDYVCDLEGIEDGNLYRWTGTYRFYRTKKDRYLDESAYKFEGTIALVPIP